MSDPDERLGLNPGLRRMWRDRTTLQLGLDPERAVVVGEVGTPIASLLAGLDGTRSTSDLHAAAERHGVDRTAFADLVAALRHLRAVDHWPARPIAVATRLAPERAALALRRTDADDVLAARATQRVLVHGGDRVAVPAAAALAAAGIGRVVVAADGTVDPADCAPGGVTPADLHRPAGEAAADAIRRACPSVETGAMTPDERPDLVLLASLAPITTELRVTLHAGAVPHLVAGVREATAVVGPLVLPGRTSCLHCADLHRTDRDPSWPLVAAQLDRREHGRVPACATAVSFGAVALAVGQTLAFLDGEPVDTVNGTLELAEPTWRIRRRSWPPHHRCGCRDLRNPLGDPHPTGHNGSDGPSR